MGSSRAIVVLGLVAAALHLAGAARAAPFEGGDSTWQGTSQLIEIARRHLGKDRVELVDGLDYAALKPADGVIVLRPLVALDYDQLSAFLRAGGRLALLDDFGTGAALLDRFHIHRIPAPRHPAEMLRHNPELAIAVPAVQQVAGYEQGRHPVVANVQKLVTNHPTALTHPNLTPVLEIPAIGEPNATLAVTGIIVNRGRLFAMGDPSAVINQMLRYPGNRAFAEGLVDYLVEDDSWGPRGGKLYVVANRLSQHGQFGGGTSLARELRDHFDGLLDTLASFHREGLPDVLATILAALTALGAAAWVGLVSMRPYRHTTPRYAAGTPLLAQGGVAGRAAVLAAPTTDRALALLELRSALVEGLGHRLGLEATVGVSALLEEIDRQDALSQRSSAELKEMLTEMTRAESAVMASRPYRVKARRLADIRSQILAMLAEVDTRIEGRS